LNVLQILHHEAWIAVMFVALSAMTVSLATWHADSEVLERLYTMHLHRECGGAMKLAYDQRNWSVARFVPFTQVSTDLPLIFRPFELEEFCNITAVQSTTVHNAISSEDVVTSSLTVQLYAKECRPCLALLQQRHWFDFLRQMDRPYERFVWACSICVIVVLTVDVVFRVIAVSIHLLYQRWDVVFDLCVICAAWLEMIAARSTYYADDDQGGSLSRRPGVVLVLFVFRLPGYLPHKRYREYLMQLYYETLPHVLHCTAYFVIAAISHIGLCLMFAILAKNILFLPAASQLNSQRKSRGTFTEFWPSRDGWGSFLTVFTMVTNPTECEDVTYRIIQSHGKWCIAGLIAAYAIGRLLFRNIFVAIVMHLVKPILEFVDRDPSLAPAAPRAPLSPSATPPAPPAPPSDGASIRPQLRSQLAGALHSSKCATFATDLANFEKERSIWLEANDARIKWKSWRQLTRVELVGLILRGTVFETLLSVMTILNLCLMAVIDIDRARNGNGHDMLLFLDWIPTFFFVCEVVMQIVAKGLVVEPKSYLRNKNDVLNLVLSIADVVSKIAANWDSEVCRSLQNIAVLRCVRVVRLGIHLSAVRASVYLLPVRASKATS
jgi:hypothetical protein